METLIELGLFVIKLAAFVLATLILVAGIVAIRQKDKKNGKNKLTITLLNQRFRELTADLQNQVLGKKQRKQLLKTEKKQVKQHEKTKNKQEHPDKVVYVIDFNGDIRASACKQLRQEITALINVATERDEIICRLESPGGMVHSYGFAASQLARIRAKNIPLTVCIDKVAASGGYLMAAVANRIIAAPYAIIGSIGVVAQFPNFNRLLKKHYVDYEMLTAGEYKRTLSMLGPNTPKGRRKFQEEIEAIHQQFKNTIRRYRPHIDIDAIATGEHWLAETALTLNLVDDLKTSDDYLLDCATQADIYHVQYRTKQKISEKLGVAAQQVIQAISHKLHEPNRWWR